MPVTARSCADGPGKEVRIHSEFTGTPVAFTQCVFHELNPDDHFIGVRPAPENGVWVYGHIRSKRSISTKNEILLGIRDLVRQVLNAPESAIWVYLNELNHTDMVEFGHVLPEPGNEQRWLDELPRDLPDRLGAAEQSRST